MTEGERITILPGVLEWFFVRNPGAAFSLASGMTWIFSLVALAVIVAIVVVARRLRSGAWATVFGAVLGGTLGNLLDRLFREPGFGEGHVIDFISTPWMIPAIYNIADIAIVLGMCAFVLVTILDIGFDGVRGRARRAQAEEPDDATTEDVASDAGSASAPASAPAEDVDRVASAPAEDADSVASSASEEREGRA